jgi:deoxycytidylate deaminase
MKEDHFLSLAKKASKRSNHRDHKIGCVIVKGNKILGVGFNVLKTHPHSPHKHKSTHAEFMAVVSSGYEVSRATAYIFRQQKNGTPAMSRPCESCFRYLTESGIKKIVYTFEGSFKEEKV